MEGAWGLLRALCIQVLELHKTLDVWRSAYFCGHMLVGGIVLLGWVLPPRRGHAKMECVEAVAMGLEPARSES